MLAQEKIDKQRIDRRPVAIDLVVHGLVTLGRMLQPSERAVACQRFAVRAQNRFRFPGQHREDRILAQCVVIVQILMPDTRPKIRCPTSVST
jgi:hypothetical protein